MRSPRVPRDRLTKLGGRAISLLRRGVGLVTLVVALVLALGPVAEAHTDFESSDPVDGSVISSPVSEIQIRFTAESQAAGDGFLVLTPEGDVVSPRLVVSPDGTNFTLLFDPPLVGGDIGVQWTVRAGDAHPIEGAFSFTTTARAISVEPTIAAEIAVEAEVELQGRVDADDVAEQPEDAGADISISETAIGLDEGTTVDTSAVSLDDFLVVNEGTGLAGPVGFAGRLASQAGSLVAIGTVFFAWFVSSQSRGEMRAYVSLVRQAAGLTIVGALVESIGLSMSLGNVNDALVGSAGFAALLRLLGAAGLVAATAASATAVEVPASIGQAPLVSAGGAFSGAVGASELRPLVEVPVARRLEPVVSFDRFAWWFSAMLALSYVFDGHTVTKGNRLLTALVDLVHVGGGAVWLGGLVCLLVLSGSHRATLDSTMFIESVVRFSVVAAVALGAVGVAGIALTVTILDSVSELWSTVWGQLLIAKVVVVGVAIAAGAFNHWVLVPELQTISAHSDARDSFVRTIVIEVAALGLAVVVTGVLVAAAL